MKELTKEEIEKQQTSHAEIENACKENCDAAQQREVKTGYSSKAKYLR